MKNRNSPWSFCVILSAALLLASCSGGSEKPLAESSDIAVSGMHVGVTPFISLLDLRGTGVDKLSSLRYTIAPKPGTLSRAVRVQYTLEALRSRGYATAASGVVTLPVFGLYAGYSNQVTLELQFADQSSKTATVTVNTAAYADLSMLYDRPNIRQKRSATSVTGFDFFYIKSAVGSPLVIDTDGEIRWVAAGVTKAISSILQDDVFFIGEAGATKFYRMGLDGSLTDGVLELPGYTGFHHNIDPGKQGFLIEMDGVNAGVRNVESILAEVNQAGAVLHQWDFAALLADYMRSQGDDPSAFVRPGIDWFHMNASTYDARDDSLIVSSRENFIIKIDYQSGNILWILGDPSKYWYSFPSLRAKALTLEAGGLYPIGQHAISITSDGSIMLFNNGTASRNQPDGAPVGENRSYSAVSAYAVDPLARTAREVWRFDYGQTIYSSICSSVYEAAGKSLLLNYSQADGGTRARLLGLDASHNSVFDFEYKTNGCSTSWNAQIIRLEDLRIDK